MTEKLRVAVVIGSTREGRFGPTVAAWAAAEARRHPELEVTVLDLAGIPLPHALGARPANPTDLDAASVVLADADAFVIVTPEYNHSFPGVLKNFIDTHYDQWRAKPVAFVSYGGMAGGLRAVEQLRLVFAELHCVTVRDTVSFHNPWGRFDDDGRPHEHEAAATAAKGMFDQLAWWARTLRDARTARPYAA
ncbi:NADPH-dependent FMN reductase [Actinomadura hibisca]|uniref:NADPH-dependent FMN reductase n=1 Tax=Actinomadura hibisca TaxID=68565 RepID=UPI0008366395|nr:NAD(P)H-dependent oxidoreductase [Actinomadura hibisca]